jgi:hypothetical protein
MFYDEALIGQEGKKVLCYFDPFDDPVTAAIYTLDGRKQIAARATCISRTQALIRDGAGYRWDADDGQLERARAAKAAARAAVRREHRSIAPDGKIEAWSTEVRDAKSRAVASMAHTTAVTTQPDHADAADPVLSTRVTTVPAPINRSQRVLTDSEESAVLARLVAKERAYQLAHPTPLNF